MYGLTSAPVVHECRFSSGFSKGISSAHRNNHGAADVAEHGLVQQLIAHASSDAPDETVLLGFGRRDVAPLGRASDDANPQRRCTNTGAAFSNDILGSLSSGGERILL